MKDALDPRPAGLPSGRVAAFAMAALLSFALNSLLCRGALGAGLIDATSFTLVRLVAGALVLGLLSRRSPNAVAGSLPHRVDRIWSTLALFLYALPFSLAYVRIEAGTGAFIVFGCVQITMVGSDLLAGRGVGRREGLGLFVALIGLASLTRPGTGSPNLAGVLLMALSGCAWGIYSILGRRSGPPLSATARNFAATIPLALLASALAPGSPHVTTNGLALALVSGGLTSGLGYVAWYAALPSLSSTRASIVQLAVPPLASALGVALLGEVLTPRLLIAAPLILGGIGIAVSASKPRA